MINFFFKYYIREQGKGTLNDLYLVFSSVNFPEFKHGFSSSINNLQILKQIARHWERLKLTEAPQILQLLYPILVQIHRSQLR